MKKLITLLLTALLLLTLISCSGDISPESDTESSLTHADSSASDGQTETVSEANTDYSIDMNYSSEPNIPIVYSSGDDSMIDRSPVTAYWMHETIEFAQERESAVALCIVSVEKLDLIQVNEIQGSYIPITLKIEKIIGSTTLFESAEEDTIIVSEQAWWRKVKEGYRVSYFDYVPPFTVTNGKYIVLLTDRSVPEIEDYGIKYWAEWHTAPIPQEGTSAEEIAETFAKMRLTWDARKTTVDLIKEQFGEDFIPSYEEIEAHYDKIWTKYAQTDYIT